MLPHADLLGLACVLSLLRCASIALAHLKMKHYYSYQITHAAAVLRLAHVHNLLYCACIAAAHLMTHIVSSDSESIRSNHSGREGTCSGIAAAILP